MTPWELGLLATALSMDAFAVAIAIGVTLEETNRSFVWRLAGHFGFFQAAMPVVGWGTGSAVYTLMARIDHWIAFVLLAIIGLKMIREGLDTATPAEPRDLSRWPTLLGLSVATSIDAFAAGLSLAVLHLAILFPAVVIGLITASWTLLGVRLGKWAGAQVHLGKYAEVLGGVVLIAIGCHILYEHGVFTL